MLISSFGAFSSGKVSVIPNIGDIVKSGQYVGVRANIIADQFKWPNDISVVPSDVFGSSINAISVPDGFLPPGKGDGGIYIITTDPADATKKEAVYQISTLKSGFFYHKG
jgi:hypothetical protein